ncbi:hypothetical protein LC092_03325 [Stappia stellulata]|uniref:hypothetical protein n=1 Tax=Stappia stellulata TaxID=71235 RepID=UPI001CD40387|nr:hypothetical protein [Stappia stellulata]MCA1241464.1 hypothetical protein [Stappia stellulata]
MRLIYMFAQGISIEITARSTRLSKKTVRTVFLKLRDRLTRPVFNRWHGTHRRLLKLVDPGHEALVRVTFFDVLAECYFNQTCHRNWTLGNRKARQCRSCPLPGKFQTDQTKADALALIDAVHELYRRLGLRLEKGHDPVRLFRLRLLHTTVVGTVLNHSRKLQTGLLDPTDMSYLACGSLIDVFLTDLANDPL